MKAPISRDEIETIASELDLRCTPGDLDQLSKALPAYFGDIDATAALWASASAEDPPPQRTFQDPEPDENALNAWTARCHIRTVNTGSLAGLTLAVKDNISVAGLPLTAGSRMLGGYRAEYDAVAVVRALAAGATITGITRCEDFCLSGGSHTGAGGPVRNPIDHARTSGGSSSGSAALVASGAVDLALGTDQGGSVRIPSSFCGIVGLKPTWERIPYAGAMSLAPSVDHVGPMARTVNEARTLFLVLADQAPAAEQAMNPSAAGLRIGLLEEGFGQTNSDPRIDDIVRSMAHGLTQEGGVIADVSVPMHRLAPPIWTAVGLAGLQHGLVSGDPWGIDPHAPYPIGLTRRFRQQLAARGFDAPLRTKQFLIAADFVRRVHGVEAAATSRNAALVLRARYDAALAGVDILAMPTTPHTAALLPDPEDLRASNFAAESMAANTCPFNLTHHPALSVPCGFVDGLPVGMMLVGRHREEEALFRAGAAVERLVRCQQAAHHPSQVPGGRQHAGP